MGFNNNYKPTGFKRVEGSPIKIEQHKIYRYIQIDILWTFVLKINLRGLQIQTTSKKLYPYWKRQIDFNFKEFELIYNEQFNYRNNIFKELTKKLRRRT